MSTACQETVMDFSFIPFSIYKLVTFSTEKQTAITRACPLSGVHLLISKTAHYLQHSLWFDGALVFPLWAQQPVTLSQC